MLPCLLAAYTLSGDLQQLLIALPKLNCSDCPNSSWAPVDVAPLQMSEEYNVAVVVTNHVVSDPGGGAMFVSDPKKPVSARCESRWWCITDMTADHMLQ